MRIILSIIITLFYFLSAFAESGVKFLTLETGAGPVGTGGAYTAITAEPYSAAYNPAAIFGINSLSGSFGHDTYWKDRRFENGYVSFKKGPVVYNFGLQFVQIDNIEARDYPSIDPDFTFSSYDFSLKLSGAFKISSTLTAGLALGWVFEKIDIYRGNVFSTDFGLIARPQPDLVIGLSVLNVGTKMKINADEFNLPTTLRLGAAYNLKNIRPALDIVYLDKEMHMHVGGEYKIKDVLFLRAGFRTGYDTKDISAGAGFINRNFRIDYAFLPYKNKLGDSHIFSLTFSL